jgi:hypothetical protein
MGGHLTLPSPPSGEGMRARSATAATPQMRNEDA